MYRQLDPHLVVAAQRGDRDALDAVIAEYLPLVYNIVGRAVMRQVDVDDVVQETMLRVVRGIGTLHEPERFRSWLVAVTMNQIRDHAADRAVMPAPLADPDEIVDPAGDFVDLTLTQLRLSGQRREVAIAARWLDPDDRHLLSLWWQETAGYITRAEMAAALDVTAHSVTMRVTRMKGQLDAARLIVRALANSPRCPGLDEAAALWRGEESPLWRKRFARHIRDCARCAADDDFFPVEGLLSALPLVALPAGYLSRIRMAARQAAPAGPARPDSRPGARHGARHGGASGRARRAIRHGGHRTPLPGKAVLAAVAVTVTASAAAAGIYRATSAADAAPSSRGSVSTVRTAPAPRRAIAADSPAPSHSPTPTPAPPPVGAVTGYQGMCLDVRGANTADYTPVQVYGCNGTSAQRWTVEPDGTIQALGKCLDVYWGLTGQGTTIDLYTCNGTGAQVWRQQPNGELVNPQSGRCLDDVGNGGPWTQLIIDDCHDDDSQQWHLP